MEQLTSHDQAAANTGPLNFAHESLNCIRCGFCLPTCPTYIETGKESASPRGRIALVKAASDGLLPLADIQEQLDLCLGCLNCVTVCPAGVQYGHLLEDAREAMAQSRRKTWLERVAFDWLLPRPGMMRLIGTLLWLYQASRLQALVHKTGLIKILPPQLRDMDRILPKVPPPWRRRHPRVTSPAPSRGGPRVAFFTGCIMDVLFWEANRDSIALLADAGCTVTVVPQQGCCGALHAHSGLKEQARELARRNIAAFEQGGFDYIVNSIGGCGAALKDYAHWLRDDPEWHHRAQAFVAKVRDLSEMLTELGYEPPRLIQEAAAAEDGRTPEAETTSPRNSRVTMQPSCHLYHGQGVRTAPADLIRGTGVDYCEMANAERCCGSAGIYNLVQPEMADKVLARKMEHAKATGARVIVTTNPGCQLQMRLGVQREGLTGQVEVLHLAEFLARGLPRRGTSGGEVA